MSLTIRITGRLWQDRMLWLSTITTSMKITLQGLALKDFSHITLFYRPLSHPFLSLQFLTEHSQSGLQVYSQWKQQVRQIFASTSAIRGTSKILRTWNRKMANYTRRILPSKTEILDTFTDLSRSHIYSSDTYTAFSRNSIFRNVSPPAEKKAQYHLS